MKLYVTCQVIFVPIKIIFQQQNWVKALFVRTFRPVFRANIHYLLLFFRILWYSI